MTNANCWAHARRAFADAVKAADKKDPLSVKNSVAYQALQKIAEFYRIDTELKELPATDRLTQPQTRIKPLVEDFFAWAKQQAAECAVPPKSRTGQGLNFVIHQENYLKVFLTDGDIPIDNSASERAVRTFCIGKKNWMFHNTAKGARASALVYSISETAKLNNLRPYYYFRYILTELPKYCDEKGNIDPAKLDQLMPWAEELPRGIPETTPLIKAASNLRVGAGFDVYASTFISFSRTQDKSLFLKVLVLKFSKLK